MTVKDLNEKSGFKMITPPADMETAVSEPFCCDLLSWAMSRAPSGCAWVTVMANLNTLAVAELTDAACIILAEGSAPDEKMKEKALEQKICIMTSSLPVFETALAVHKLLCP